MPGIVNLSQLIAKRYRLKKQNKLVKNTRTLQNAFMIVALEKNKDLKKTFASYIKKPHRKKLLVLRNNPNFAWHLKQLLTMAALLERENLSSGAPDAIYTKAFKPVYEPRTWDNAIANLYPGVVPSLDFYNLMHELEEEYWMKRIAASIDTYFGYVAMDLLTRLNLASAGALTYQ